MILKPQVAATDKISADIKSAGEVFVSKVEAFRKTGPAILNTINRNQIEPRA
jgi:hypothetical protein